MVIRANPFSFSSIFSTDDRKFRAKLNAKKSVPTFLFPFIFLTSYNEIYDQYLTAETSAKVIKREKYRFVCRHTHVKFNETKARFVNPFTVNFRNRLRNLIIRPSLT